MFLSSVSGANSASSEFSYEKNSILPFFILLSIERSEISDPLIVSRSETLIGRA